MNDWTRMKENAHLNAWGNVMVRYYQLSSHPKVIHCADRSLLACFRTITQFLFNYAMMLQYILIQFCLPLWTIVQIHISTENRIKSFRLNDVRLFICLYLSLVLQFEITCGQFWLLITNILLLRRPIHHLLSCHIIINELIYNKRPKMTHLKY